MTDKIYIIWKQDDGRSYSSLEPSGIRGVMGNLSRGGLETIARDATVFVLALDDGELSVEKLEPTKENVPD